MKLTAWDIKHLNAFIEPAYPSDGFTITRKLSEWTTGRGKYTRLKNLPPFVHRAEKYDDDHTKNMPKKYTVANAAVKKFF